MPGTITSDQLLLSTADATYGEPWANVGSFTTGPSIVDDYRIEGTNCNRGRLSASVRGFSLCAMPGADRVWQFDAAPTPAYVDITTAFNNATTADTVPFVASSAAGDQCAIGWQIPIGGLFFTSSTLGTTGEVKWRYLNNAGAWTDLSNVSDGTNSFKTSSTSTTNPVTWDIPNDWGKRVLNGSGPFFWVAAEVTTGYATHPILSQGFLCFTPSYDYMVFQWFNCAAPASSDTWANGGLRIGATSDLTMSLTGTWPNSGPNNSRQWYVNGNDGLKQSGFLPYTWDAGIAGSLTLGTYASTRVRRVGVGMGSIAAMANANFNFFWDRVSIGTGLSVTDGTAGSPADFVSVFSADHTTSVMWGVITRTAGIYLLNGKLYIGNSTQANLSYFKDTNQVIVYQNFPVPSTYYEIRVVGLSGKTSTFQLGNFASGLASGGCTIRGASRSNAADPSPAVAVWNLTGSDAFAVVNLYGSSFSELYRASLNSVSEVRFCTFKDFGNITANATLFDNCTFLDLKTAAPTSATYAIDAVTAAPTITNCEFVNCATAVRWPIDTMNPNGKLDGSQFTSGGTGHAIEFTGAATSRTLNNVSFAGYSGTSTNAAVYVNTSAGSLTLTISGGGTDITGNVRVAPGVTVTVVAGARAVTVSVVNTEGTAVTGANVFLRAGPGGPFPYLGSVTTITRSGTVATVSHTSHGLANDDKVLIAGITDKTADNRVVTITKINDDSYSFVTTDSGSTNYTGATKTATFVFLNGLADGGDDSNEITMSRSIPSSQPVVGWARKGSGAPLYKTGTISGNASSTSDSSFSAVLVSDD